MGSCLFDFGVVLDYVSTSAGVIQVFGPKLCAILRLGRQHIHFRKDTVLGGNIIYRVFQVLLGPQNDISGPE